MDLLIDRTTGEFTVDAHRLGPDLAEAEFLRSDLGKAAGKHGRSAPYYVVWRKIDGGIEIGMTLKFSSSGPLQRIGLQFVKQGVRGSDWTRAMEDEIKVFHDRWLKERLGDPPYRFPWGTVRSFIEPHWYSANIAIEYAA